MKVLIVDDDFTSRKLLQAILSPFAYCDIAVDGVEALDAFKLALEEGSPYDLVCLDIMMPNMDGHVTLGKIREMEREMNRTGNKEVSVIMATALDDPKNVFKALNKGGAMSYLVKPIDKNKLLKEIEKMGFALRR